MARDKESTRYYVNVQHLDIDAAAAICAALQYHYGEPCMERIAESVDEQGFDLRFDDEDSNCLCRVIEK